MVAQADTMMAPHGTMAKHGFIKAEAPVSGSFKIKKEGGKQVLVLSSDFKTNDMAPDLKVVLSPSTTPLASSKPPAYPLKPGTYTVLAPLKSAAGAQSYVIPASIDLSKQGLLVAPLDAAADWPQPGQGLALDHTLTQHRQARVGDLDAPRQSGLNPARGGRIGNDLAGEFHAGGQIRRCGGGQGSRLGRQSRLALSL